MAGIENKILFANGEKLQPSSSQDISDMQNVSTDVSRINHTGNPEGVVSANPSSLSHDPVSGNIYFKQTGTGNTGWILLGAFQPNNLVEISDDFIGTNNTATFNSQQSWFENGLDTKTEFDSNHPGVISNSSITLNDRYIYLSQDDNGLSTPMQIGGGVIILNWVMKLAILSDMTNSYILRLGFGDTHNADMVNGLYFEYSDGINSGNWVIKTANSSTRTTTNTSTAADTDWHNFQIIVNADGTSVEFFIDDISQGTISTNLPTDGITAFVNILLSAGIVAADSILIDLFYMKQILTNSR